MPSSLMCTLVPNMPLCTLCLAVRYVLEGSTGCSAPLLTHTQRHVFALAKPMASSQSMMVNSTSGCSSFRTKACLACCTRRDSCAKLISCCHSCLRSSRQPVAIVLTVLSHIPAGRAAVVAAHLVRVGIGCARLCQVCIVVACAAAHHILQGTALSTLAHTEQRHFQQPAGDPWVLSCVPLLNPLHRRCNNSLGLAMCNSV